MPHQLDWQQELAKTCRQQRRINIAKAFAPMIIPILIVGGVVLFGILSAFSSMGF